MLMSLCNLRSRFSLTQSTAIFLAFAIAAAWLCCFQDLHGWWRWLIFAVKALLTNAEGAQFPSVTDWTTQRPLLVASVNQRPFIEIHTSCCSSMISINDRIIAPSCKITKAIWAWQTSSSCALRMNPWLRPISLQLTGGEIRFPSHHDSTSVSGGFERVSVRLL